MELEKVAYLVLQNTNNKETNLIQNYYYLKNSVHDEPIHNALNTSIESNERKNESQNTSETNVFE
jgi:hypothetical protein